jgi:hypothetical protein
LAIVYPLDLPTIVYPTSFTITPIATVATSRSPYTLGAQYHEKSGAGWMLQLEYPNMKPDEMREFQAFIVGLNGRRGTFRFGDYLQGSPRGLAIGTPVVHGGGQTGETLSTRGWAANIVVLMRGDWIQIGSRLHMVTTDSVSNAGGLATLDIWPRIRIEGVVDGQEIITQNAKGVWRLAENQNPWSAGFEKYYTTSINAIEDL